MNLITAVDEQWNIGKNGALLFSIPRDMKFFRNTTEGNVVVMGRKTLESLPGGKPLKNRTNIVLSHNPEFTMEGVIVCHSLTELFQEIKQYEQKRVYVIGGGNVYRALLPYCHMAYVTRIEAVKEDADCSIPDLDDNPAWEITAQSESYEHDGLHFSFYTYYNHDVRPME